jgi:hypothetical protein
VVVRRCIGVVAIAVTAGCGLDAAGELAADAGVDGVAPTSDSSRVRPATGDSSHDTARPLGAPVVSDTGCDAVADDVQAIPDAATDARLPTADTGSDAPPDSRESTDVTVPRDATKDGVAPARDAPKADATEARDVTVQDATPWDAAQADGSSDAEPPPDQCGYVYACGSTYCNACGQGCYSGSCSACLSGWGTCDQSWPCLTDFSSPETCGDCDTTCSCHGMKIPTCTLNGSAYQCGCT